MVDWKEDKFQRGEPVRPRYLVAGQRVGTGFYAPEYAVAWQEHLQTLGVVTKILDLTNYDWEKNPGNIQMFAMNKSKVM